MRRIDAHVGGDRWQGSFPVTRQGLHAFTFEAWTDHFATWRREIERKVQAGQEDFGGELSEGVALLNGIAQRAEGEDADRLRHVAEHLTVDAALDPELLAIAERHPDRTSSSVLDTPLALDVDRVRARFGAWYELFPRSWGGFTGVANQIPRLAELGFD